MEENIQTRESENKLDEEESFVTETFTQNETMLPKKQNKKNKSNLLKSLLKSRNNVRRELEEEIKASISEDGKTLNFTENLVRLINTGNYKDIISRVFKNMSQNELKNVKNIYANNKGLKYFPDVSSLLNLAHIDCSLNSLTELNLPEFTGNVRCESNCSLISIYIPKTTHVSCLWCDNLKTLDAPEATKVDCTECEKLETISAPLAKKVYHVGCFNLKTLTAPNIETEPEQKQESEDFEDLDDFEKLERVYFAKSDINSPNKNRAVSPFSPEKTVHNDILFRQLVEFNNGKMEEDLGLQDI